MPLYDPFEIRKFLYIDDLQTINSAAQKISGDRIEAWLMVLEILSD